MFSYCQFSLIIGYSLRVSNVRRYVWPIIVSRIVMPIPLVMGVSTSNFFRYLISPVLTGMDRSQME